MRRPRVLDGQRVTPRARPALYVVREPALELPAMPTPATAPRDGWRQTLAIVGAGLAVVAATLALAYGISLLARTN